MALLPSDVPYGTVQGTWFFADEDGADAGATMELLQITGTLTFTCSAPLLSIPTKPGAIVPLVFDAYFDSNGVLRPKNDPTANGIQLPATDSALVTPTGFTWRVDFHFKDPATGKYWEIPSYSFQLPTGSTVQLDALVPVSTSAGTITIAGPPNILSLGTVTTGAPGSAAAASITGSSPSQVLNLTIPQGYTPENIAVNPLLAADYTNWTTQWYGGGAMTGSAVRAADNDFGGWCLQKVWSVGGVASGDCGSNYTHNGIIAGQAYSFSMLYKGNFATTGGVVTITVTWQDSTGAAIGARVFAQSSDGNPATTTANVPARFRVQNIVAPAGATKALITCGPYGSRTFAVNDTISTGMVSVSSGAVDRPTFPGPAGPTGPTGPTGATGSNGTQGPAGVADDTSVSNLVKSTTSQLSTVLRAMFTGDWQPNTPYSVGQVAVTPAGVPILCKTAHTSGSAYSGASWAALGSGGAAIRTNLATNPSFEAGAGTATVRTNYATNSSFEAPWGGGSVAVRTNLALDPAATALTNWTSVGGATNTRTVDTTTVHSGTSSIKTVVTSANNSGAEAIISNPSFANGDTVKWSIWVYPSVTMSFSPYWERTTPTYTGGYGGSAVSCPANTWTKITGSVTLNAGQADATGSFKFGILSSTAFAVNDLFYTDEILVERAGGPVGTYFDGATAAAGDYTYAWTGTANASSSTQSATGVGSWGTGGVAPKTTRSTEQISNRLYSGKVWWPAAAAGSTAIREQLTAAQAPQNSTWTASAYVYVPAGQPGAVIWLGDYSVNTVSAVTTTTGAWVRISTTLTVTGTSGLYLDIRPPQNAATNGSEIVYVDGVLLEQSSSVLGPYFDGSTAAGGDYTYAWSGVADASFSYQNGVGIAGSGVWGGVVAYQSTAWANSRTYSCRVTPNSQTSTDSFFAPGGDTGAMRLGMTAGNTYTASATVRLSAALTGSVGVANGALLVKFLYRDSGGNYQSFSSPAAANAAGSTRLSVTVSIPAGATEAFVRLYHGGLQGSGDVWWDDFLLEQSGVALPYFDGSMSGNSPEEAYAWSGAADASTSTLTLTMPKIVYPWAPNTVYGVGVQVVGPNNEILTVTTAHTSTATIDYTKFNKGADSAAKGLMSLAEMTAAGGAVNALTIVQNIPTFTFKANRWYEVKWTGTFYSSTTDSTYTWQLFTCSTADAASATTGLTQLKYTSVHPDVAGEGRGATIIRQIKYGVDTTLQIKIAVQRGTGTGNITPFPSTTDPAQLAIVDMGAQV